MLNFAMVMMILAGVFGLPAAACSTACAGVFGAAATQPGADPAAAAGATAIVGVFMVLALLASIGSIIVGALVRKIGKTPAVIAALIFALLFVLLLLQANPFGLPSAAMLLTAAIMIFVAPRPEYTGVSEVKVTG